MKRYVVSNRRIYGSISYEYDWYYDNQRIPFEDNVKLSRCLRNALLFQPYNWYYSFQSQISKDDEFAFVGFETVFYHIWNCDGVYVILRIEFKE